jgi:hypothetical protein
MAESAAPFSIATIPRSTLVARGLWPLWHGLPVAHSPEGQLMLHPTETAQPDLCWSVWRREADGAWRTRCAHHCVRVEESLWCSTCDLSPRWPDQEQCDGCLRAGVPPSDTVPMFAVHWDLAVAMASLRRRVVYWEEKHPRWVLVPDYQRIWEESAPPSKYADRETTMGRKLVQARWRVERRHPRGLRSWLPWIVGIDSCYGSSSWRLHNPWVRLHDEMHQQMMVPLLDRAMGLMAKSEART